jgi:hypothetical protein
MRPDALKRFYGQERERLRAPRDKLSSPYALQSFKPSAEETEARKAMALREAKIQEAPPPDSCSVSLPGPLMTASAWI